MADEIPLSRPDITDLEIGLVNDVLRSERLSIGPMQERFEEMVAEASGCHHGVAVSSGTAGLHTVLTALGVGPGDEVITTPFSFIAPANAILYCGGTPVFADIEPGSLNMDPKKLEAAITPRTKAILAVETFGNPAHMDTYARIAASHEIPLIEDCCEALGSSLRGRRCGSFGRVGIFAFYPNKQITTGEGGMIVTDDERLATLCRSLRNQGRSGKPTPVHMHRGEGGQAGGVTAGSWLHHDRLGFNYRLSEVASAIGVGQMSRLDDIIERRQAVANHYMQRLIDEPQVIAPTVPEGAEMSWFVFVIRLDSSYTREERDRVIGGMRRHDVGCSDYFPCIHLQPHFQALGFEEGDAPVAESVSRRTIALPFYNDLTDHEVDFVVQTLRLMLSRENLNRG
ncbi:MAG: DegT/DnrJ/EryC1/StrS family aminotransferase [Planctomycetota bacterium]